MMAVVTDAEQWAELQSQKLAALVDALGADPDFAGRTLMVMEITAVEARGLVAQAVVDAEKFPAAADTVRALMPTVRSWLTCPAVVELMGEDAEPRGLLWAWIVALGRACAGDP